MREITRKVEKNGVGFVKVEPIDAEDMWQLYNLLSAGDELTASTIRKVQQESSTGSSSTERVRLNLSIKVDTVDFDSSVGSIRVRGRVSQENEHVRVGAFHTLELEPHRAVTLRKKVWDSGFVERLDFALDAEADADVGAVVMEEGLGHVLLIGRSLTLTKAKVEVNIPRKGANALFNRESALKSFFEHLYREVTQHFDWDNLKVVLIASPGFTKDEFYKFALLQAARQDVKGLLENKSKIILCHSSSGHKHTLDEVLKRPELQSRLSKTKAVVEIQLLNEFHNMLKVDDTRATYGPAFVKYASEMGAVDKLLITDTLFRANNVEQRKKFISLTEEVKGSGGSVTIFSTQHVSGEQLVMMGGIAAILRFPLADLDEVEPSDTL